MRQIKGDYARIPMSSTILWPSVPFKLRYATVYEGDNNCIAGTERVNGYDAYFDVSTVVPVANEFRVASHSVLYCISY